MEVTRKMIENIANGKTNFDNEVVRLGNVILENDLVEQFIRYASGIDGDVNDPAFVYDLFTDFPTFGAEIRVIVDKSVNPKGVYQVFGMTIEESLKRLSDRVFRSTETMNVFDNALFIVNGINGLFKISEVMMHYCFGKGRISVNECIESMRVA